MKKIVVAYDFSKHADVALAHAIEVACGDADSTLHFVTVLDKHQDHLVAERVHQDLVARLHSVFETRRPDAHIEFYVHARIGDPVPEILDLAKDIGADMVILGSHGRGPVGRLLIGSVSEGVLHGAKCPVLIVREKGYPYVKLDKIVELPPHAIRRDPPHRYSYSGSKILTRPSEWPIS